MSKRIAHFFHGIFASSSNPSLSKLNSPKVDDFVKRESSGSALLVTILLMSVMVIFGITLLDRITAYSREVRSVEDAVQASYEARGQVELGKRQFISQNSRSDIDTISHSRIKQNIPGLVNLDLPGNNPEYVVISQSKTLPLSIKTYPQDNARYFGISSKNATQHTLTSQGSLSFDVKKFPGTGGVTSPTLEIETTDSNLPLKVEFIFEESNGTMSSFQGTLTTPNSAGSANLLGSVDLTSPPQTLSDFLADKDCSLGESCILKISIDDPLFRTTDFTLKASEDISDLNAILVADGFSHNTLYHQRIVEIIPMIQGL